MPDVEGFPELPRDRCECIAQGRMDIFVPVLVGHDLVSGDVHIDADLVLAAVALVLAQGLDCDAAIHYPRIVAFKPFGQNADSLRESCGTTHVAKSDLRGIHGGASQSSWTRNHVPPGDAAPV
jgi:hypothetical protein